MFNTKRITVISANFDSFIQVIAKQRQVFAENIIYQSAAPEILAELCKKQTNKQTNKKLHCKN